MKCRTAKLTLALVCLLAIAGSADAVQYLKQSTAKVISFGPLVDKADAVTLKTGLVSALDNASTGIVLSKSGGAFAVRHATVTATTYDSRGNYLVTLDTTDTNTLGPLRVQYEDATTCLPVWRDFIVVPANTYDSLIGNTDSLNVNTMKVGPSGSGTAQTARDLGLALPAAAPDTAGGLRTSLQGPVTWYVQSTGNDSNSGLSRTSPLATIAQAITNYRHGDTIWLIGANTTTGIAPIKWFILDGDRNASLTSTTAGANITLGSGANGSIIRHVAITNSGGSVGDDFGTITITNATNITIEDVPNVTNTNGFYGIKIGDSSFAASNVVLRGVTATGKYRGLGIIDSFVRSTNGNYSGTESGIYMDANNGDCWLYSDSDRGTGSTAAATSVTGPTYHTTAGLFYECHVTDPFAKNHIRLLNPTLKGISTHASYPDPVGSLIGEAATGQSIADIQILHGRSIVRNGNSGGITRHIYPTSISTCQVTDHDHDRTKDSSVVNDGSVIDWARVRNGTTSNALSATTLSTSQQVALSTAGVTALQDASTTGHTTSGTIGGDIHTASTANSVSPFIVDDDHTWSFDNRTQITSPDILTESVGEATIYKAVDFSEALTANGSIASITAVTVADVANQTKPTVTTSAISSDKKKVNITLNATSATAATYTVTVSITSTDSRTFTRRGKLTLE